MKTLQEEKDLQELKWLRLSEQKANKDYAYTYNGCVERCNDCGSDINSHGHCPICDY